MRIPRVRTRVVASGIIAIVLALWWGRSHANTRRTADAPSGAMATLLGTAQWVGPIAALGGGTLSVRVVDLEAGDPARILLASTEVTVPRGAATAAWQLQIAAADVPRLDHAILVAATSEHGRVRYLASGAPTRFQYALRRDGGRSALDPMAVVLAPTTTP